MLSGAEAPWPKCPVNVDQHSFARLFWPLSAFKTTFNARSAIPLIWFASHSFARDSNDLEWASIRRFQTVLPAPLPKQQQLNFEWAPLCIHFGLGDFERHLSGPRLFKQLNCIWMLTVRILQPEDRDTLERIATILSLSEPESVISPRWLATAMCVTFDKFFERLLEFFTPRRLL